MVLFGIPEEMSLDSPKERSESINGFTDGDGLIDASRSSGFGDKKRSHGIARFKQPSDIDHDNLLPKLSDRFEFVPHDPVSMRVWKSSGRVWQISRDLGDGQREVYDFRKGDIERDGKPAPKPSRVKDEQIEIRGPSVVLGKIVHEITGTNQKQKAKGCLAHFFRALEAKGPWQYTENVTTPVVDVDPKYAGLKNTDTSTGSGTAISDLTFGALSSPTIAATAPIKKAPKATPKRSTPNAKQGSEKPLEKSSPANSSGKKRPRNGASTSSVGAFPSLITGDVPTSRGKLESKLIELQGERKELEKNPTGKNGGRTLAVVTKERDEIELRLDLYWKKIKGEVAENIAKRSTGQESSILLPIADFIEFCRHLFSKDAPEELYRGDGPGTESLYAKIENLLAKCGTKDGDPISDERLRSNGNVMSGNSMNCFSVANDGEGLLARGNGLKELLLSSSAASSSSAVSSSSREESRTTLGKAATKTAKTHNKDKNVSIIGRFGNDIIRNFTGLSRDPSMVGASGSYINADENVGEMASERRGFIVTDAMLQQYFSGGTIANMRVLSASAGRQKKLFDTNNYRYPTGDWKACMVTGNNQCMEVDHSSLFPLVEIKIHGCSVSTSSVDVSRRMGSSKLECNAPSSTLQGGNLKLEFILKLANTVGYLEHNVQSYARFQAEGVTAQVRIHKNLKDASLPSDVCVKKITTGRSRATRKGDETLRKKDQKKPANKAPWEESDDEEDDDEKVGDGLSKYWIPNNDGDEKYSHPHMWNMQFPLRPEQLRALGWLMNRERGQVKYTVDIKRYSPGNLFLNEQSLCGRCPQNLIGDKKVYHALNSNYNDRRLIQLYAGYEGRLDQGSRYSDQGVTFHSGNDFQRCVINWCVEYNLRLEYKLRGALLCDKPGHGKTATTIALILHTLEKPLQLIGDNYYSRRQLRNGVDPMVAGTSNISQSQNLLTESQQVGPSSRRGSQDASLDQDAEPSDGFVLEPGMFSCPNTTLILVPHRLLKQWAGEFQKFTGKKDYPKILCINDFESYRRLTVKDIESAHVLLIPYSVLFSEKYQERVRTLYGLLGGVFRYVEPLNRSAFGFDKRPNWSKDKPNAHLLKLATEEFIQDSMKKAQVWWKKNRAKPKAAAVGSKSHDIGTGIAASSGKLLSNGGEATKKQYDISVAGGVVRNKVLRNDFQIKDTSRLGRRFYKFWCLNQKIQSGKLVPDFSKENEDEDEQNVSSDSCFDSDDLSDREHKALGNMDSSGDEDKPAKRAKLQLFRAGAAVGTTNKGTGIGNKLRKLSKHQQEAQNARRRLRKANRAAEEAKVTEKAFMKPQNKFHGNVNRANGNSMNRNFMSGDFFPDGGCMNGGGSDGRFVDYPKRDIHGITEELRSKLYHTEKLNLKKGAYYGSVRKMQKKYRKQGFPNFWLWGYPEDVPTGRCSSYNVYKAVKDAKIKRVLEDGFNPYGYSAYCGVPDRGGAYNLLKDKKLVVEPESAAIDWMDFADPTTLRFPVLEQIKFGRIVFDEFHESESFKDQEVHRLCNLNAHSRVGLTGTPSVNDSRSIIGSASILQVDFLAQDPRSVLLYNDLSHCAKKFLGHLEDEGKSHLEVFGDLDDNKKVPSYVRWDRKTNSIFQKDFRNVVLEHYDVYPNLLWGKAVIKKLQNDAVVATVAEEAEFKKFRNSLSFPAICPPEIIHKGETNELLKKKPKQDTLEKTTGKAPLILKLPSATSETKNSKIASSSNLHSLYLPYMCNFCGSMSYIDLDTQNKGNGSLKLDFHCYACNNRNLTNDIFCEDSLKSLVKNQKRSWGFGSNGFGGSGGFGGVANADDLDTIISGASLAARMKTLGSLKLNYRSQVLQRNEFLATHSWNRSSSITNECNRFVMNLMRQNSIAGIEDHINLVEKIVMVKLTPSERLLYKNRENEVAFGLGKDSDKKKKKKPDTEEVEVCDVGLFGGVNIIPDYNRDAAKKKNQKVFGLFSNGNSMSGMEGIEDGFVGTASSSSVANGGKTTLTIAHHVQDNATGELGELQVNRAVDLSAEELNKRTMLLKFCCHFKKKQHVTLNPLNPNYNPKLDPNHPDYNPDLELDPEEEVKRVREEKKKETELKILEMKKTILKMEIYKRATGIFKNEQILPLMPGDVKERIPIMFQNLELLNIEVISDTLKQKFDPNVRNAVNNVQISNAKKSRFQVQEDEVYDKIHSALESTLADFQSASCLELVERAYGERSDTFHDLQRYLRRDLMIQERDREVMGGEDSYSHRLRAKEKIALAYSMDPHAASIMPSSLPLHIPPRSQHEVEERIDLVLADHDKILGDSYNWCRRRQEAENNETQPQQGLVPPQEKMFRNRPEAFVEGWGIERCLEEINKATRRKIRLAKAERKRQKEELAMAMNLSDDSEEDAEPVDSEDDASDDVIDVNDLGKSKRAKKKETQPPRGIPNSKKESPKPKSVKAQPAQTQGLDGSNQLAPSKKRPQVDKTVIDINNKILQEYFKADLMAFTELNLKEELDRKIQQTLNSLEGEFAFERLRQISAGNLSFFKSEYGEKLDKQADDGNAGDEEEELECTICMCDYVPEDMRIIERCSHTFCTSCLAESLKISKHCSICRGPCPDIENSTSNLAEVLASYKKLDPKMKKKLKEGEELSCSSMDINKPKQEGKNVSKKKKNVDKAEPKDDSGGPIPVNGSHESWLAREAVDLTEYEDQLKKIERHGSKNYSIMTALKKIFADDADARVIIFVQFSDLKDQIGDALNEYGYKYATIEEKNKHSRSRQKFNASAGVGRYFGSVADNTHSSICSLTDFQEGNRDDLRVLLLSLDREASGLNLTIANHVLLVHPMCAATSDMACNYESQAVARVRRMGQVRSEVYVWRFVTEKTVEQELVAEHRAEIRVRKEMREAHMQKVKERETAYKKKDQKLKEEDKHGIQGKGHISGGGGNGVNGFNASSSASSSGKFNPFGGMSGTANASGSMLNGSINRSGSKPQTGDASAKPEFPSGPKEPSKGVSNEVLENGWNDHLDDEMWEPRWDDEAMSDDAIFQMSDEPIDPAPMHVVANENAQENSGEYSDIVDHQGNIILKGNKKRPNHLNHEVGKHRNQGAGNPSPPQANPLQPANAPQPNQIPEGFAEGDAKGDDEDIWCDGILIYRARKSNEVIELSD